jgi:hypothetical protein
MNEKTQLLTALRDEFNHWDELLNSLPEEQITARLLPSDLSIKDVVAHLWSWQQRTVARMEAAANGTEPRNPGWPEGLDPETDEDLDKINAWIHETNLDKPWSQVYGDWRSQFARLLDLTESVPEADLMQPGKYSWLGDYPLSDVLEGTYEHHDEHRGSLLAWLGQHGSTKAI